MTAEELIHEMNTVFGLNEWPKTYQVTPETYGYACQSVFDATPMKIYLGPHNGLLFRGVELLVRKI